MPSVRPEAVKNCPFCGSVWIIEDDSICHRCHRGFHENGAKPMMLKDFMFTR